MQVGRAAIKESPARSRIGAYVAVVEDETEASDAVEPVALEPIVADRHPPSTIVREVADALDALDAAVARFVKAPAEVAIPTSPAKEVPRDRDARALAEPAGEEAVRSRTAERVASARVPRGLLYWLAVGASAGFAWLSASSLYRVAVAALIASAAVITLEIVLRMIDPSIARRLGLGRPQGRVLFAAGAGLAALLMGIAVAYLV